MKKFNVTYKLRNTTTDELFFIEVQSEHPSKAIEQVNQMNSDYIAMSVVSPTFIKLFKRYTKCYDKLKSKGDMLVFGEIDNFLNENSYHTPYLPILSSHIVCDSLTPTSIYIADDKASADLYELSDYTMLLLVEWIEGIVEFTKGKKF